MKFQFFTLQITLKETLWLIDIPKKDSNDEFSCHINHSVAYNKARKRKSESEIKGKLAHEHANKAKKNQFERQNSLTYA